MTFIPAQVKPTIELSDVEKIDVRVGTILTVESIDGSEKLVQLTVDFGDHQRTIVAGLKKERSDLAEIEGKQALFIVNLAPRKMRGVTSNGMLFDIGFADALVPVLAVPEKQIENGARAG